MMRSPDLEKQINLNHPWATMKDWETDSLLEIPASTSVELDNGENGHLTPPFPLVSPEVEDTGNGKNGGIPEPPPDEEERGFLPVLRNKNFLALWSGQLFSQLADKVYLVLMIAIISTRFQQADQTISGWVSAIMMAFTIPAVLFGAGAGVFVDRWSKKAVLVITNLLRGGLVLSLPLVLWLSQGQQFGQLPVGFYILLITTFLVSTLTQFFAPAEQAAIPLIVEKRHLLSANSLYTTTMMASVIVGFAVGEPLLALADLIGNYLGFESIGKEVIVGGEYVIAGLILILLNTKEQNNNSPHEQPHVLADLRDGIRYLSNHPLIRNALLQLIILFSIFAALAVLAVRLAEVIPEISSSQFGFLLAAGGAGMGIGATVLGHLGHRFSHFQLALMGSFGVAGSLVGLSIFNQQLWPTLSLISCLGIFGAIVAIPMQTTIQAETPEEMRGKVFGLQNNAINIALSLPLALAGFAETLIGLSNVFLSLAGLAIAGGFVTWLISRNSPHIVE
ncbi:Permease of the major facilitator superfamily [Planktothrix serta PCC 8927]|uniref:Permease of the major facilitator superfamily n=1 Tax=Planktothrix serta PCC 8927 TaxID=671068 RepID=A0A7Z9BVP9_9CYAN|nr:MFS transporter [Planktothrix serta]VXD22332.1 Permease of the major facilitator superfamily [Planktothrix serta PCC 8927]